MHGDVLIAVNDLRDSQITAGQVMKVVCSALNSLQVVSAGADSLVKLWSARTSECTATFDEHEGKVWALAAAGENDAVLATGGADARVRVWRDCTAEDEANAAAERAETVLKAQDLANALKVPMYHMPCSLIHVPFV